MNHRDCKDRSKDSTIAEPMTEPPLQPHADIPRDAQEDAVPKTSHEAPVAHMPQQYEWKYTGRSEQDRTSTIHPLVAPAGNLVQKSEGFQRFYKAVVSPTHVRVTAGGRIVPNTRGPPSPTSKRAKEAPGIDNQSAAENATQPNLTASRMGSIAGTPMAAFVPQYIPGFTPGQPSLYPGMSFIPLAYGPPFPAGFPFAPGSNPFQQQVAATESNALKETQNSKDVESSMQPAAAAPDQTDNVRLAPPEQFDSTRPFWFNGQLLYPYPRPAPLPGQPSGSFMPFPMMSMPPGLGMPHHPFAGQMLPGGPNSSSMAPPMMPANPPGAAPMPSQMVPAIHPNPAPMHNSMAPMMPQNPNASAAHHPPMAPHASSIRQSEITKKQIGNFKATLKFFEDQLLYNRHQIDEKDFELKIQNTKANIEKFNATLQQQLQFEAAHYPRTQDEHERTEQQVPAATTLAETARKARMTQTDSSSSTFDVVEKLLSIPSEAALAPVFEPRVHSASWGETDTRQGSRVDLERRSIPANAGRDSSSARADTTSSTGSFKAANPRPAYRESSTTGSSAEQSVKFNVPYLLGSLPAGVDPRTAKDSDYTYVRPLTEDELRARHLYWGKAPKVARQGLPKYDGRHFYPASPVKEHGSRAQAADVYDADPFRTGATAVARTNSPAGSDDSECAALQHASSFETQVPYKSESMERIARGEEPMASSKLLKAVVTKGATSSALSPATAQGYLPQYTGYAAASLSPSGNRNQASSARETSPSKLSAPGANDHMSASLGEGGAMHGHHIENRPIAMVSTEAMRRGLH